MAIGRRATGCVFNNIEIEPVGKSLNQYIYMYEKPLGAKQTCIPEYIPEYVPEYVPSHLYGG